jgi:hypothetical protein
MTEEESPDSSDETSGSPSPLAVPMPLPSQEPEKAIVEEFRMDNPWADDHGISPSLRISNQAQSPAALLRAKTMFELEDLATPLKDAVPLPSLASPPLPSLVPPLSPDPERSPTWRSKMQSPQELWSDSD